MKVIYLIIVLALFKITVVMDYIMQRFSIKISFTLKNSPVFC